MCRVPDARRGVCYGGIRANRWPHTTSRHRAEGCVSSAYRFGTNVSAARECFFFSSVSTICSKLGCGKKKKQVTLQGTSSLGLSHALLGATRLLAEVPGGSNGKGWADGLL
jgi:hypothetical protein